MEKDLMNRKFGGLYRREPIHPPDFLTRKRAAEEDLNTKENNEKRAKLHTIFDKKKSNETRSNEILVNRNLGKIKTETDIPLPPLLKEEVGETTASQNGVQAQAWFIPMEGDRSSGPSSRSASIMEPCQNHALPERFSFMEHGESFTIVQEKERIIKQLASAKAANGADDESAIQNIDAKAIALFPQVLPVYWGRYAERQRHSRELLNLNCRLVCKEWKSAVDKIITGNIATFPHVDDSVSISLRNVNSKRLEEHVKILIAKYAPESSCPFPPRSMEIIEFNEIIPVDVIAGSRRCVRKLLSLIGKTFKKFIHKTEIRRHYTSLSDWYSTVRSWLVLMPNLEEINLRFPENFDATVEDLYALQDLEEAVKAQPFPQLKNLKSLRANLPASVLQTALINNNHIENLHVCLCCSFDFMSFPSLNRLSTKIYPQHWDYLITLNFVDAPSLETLCISTAPGSTDECYLYLDCIFHVVSNFLNSLKHLELQLPEYSTRYATFPVVIPNLRKLSLDLGGRKQNSDISDHPHQENLYWNEDHLVKFISPLKSLENLTIENFNIDPVGGWLMVNQKSSDKGFKLGVRKLIGFKLVSKLWEFLPFLKKVEVRLTSEVHKNLKLNKYLYIRKTGFSCMSGIE